MKAWVSRLDREKISVTPCRQAIDDLQIAQGDQVTAFFKATEVILHKAG
jgi:molybdopterin-binding protein